MSIRATATVDERERYGLCFACGERNETGLQLEFEATDNNHTVTAVYAPQERHQGWPQALHGGIVATLLDEAAAYVAYARGQHAATARLNIRYSRPARLDEPLRVSASLVRDARRILTIDAHVSTLDDQRIADAQATLLLLTERQERDYGLTTHTLADKDRDAAPMAFDGAASKENSREG